MKIKGLISIMLLAFALASQAQEPMVKIALLKYSGGGDWYANPTSLPNLAAFCNNQLGTNISNNIPTVDPGSMDIFNFPFLHMTGHGNVLFSAQETDNLRTYLFAGGFLHIDDNYGMDPYIRPQIANIFPEYELIEIPYTHAIFHQNWDFSKGLPKIHEHDNKAPQAFGIFIEGRLVLLYTYECDLGDGWEDQAVHGDSQETRLKALQMGANIIQYVFEGE
jgi:hypothetical protein